MRRPVAAVVSEGASWRSQLVFEPRNHRPGCGQVDPQAGPLSMRNDRHAGVCVSLCHLSSPSAATGRRRGAIEWRAIWDTCRASARSAPPARLFGRAGTSRSNLGRPQNLQGTRVVSGVAELSDRMLRDPLATLRSYRRQHADARGRPGRNGKGDVTVDRGAPLVAAIRPERARRPRRLDARALESRRAVRYTGAACRSISATPAEPAPARIPGQWIDRLTVCQPRVAMRRRTTTISASAPGGRCWRQPFRSGGERAGMLPYLSAHALYSQLLPAPFPSARCAATRRN